MFKFVIIVIMCFTCVQYNLRDIVRISATRLGTFILQQKINIWCVIEMCRHVLAYRFRCVSVWHTCQLMTQITSSVLLQKRFCAQTDGVGRLISFGVRPYATWSMTSSKPQLSLSCSPIIYSNTSLYPVFPCLGDFIIFHSFISLCWFSAYRPNQRFSQASEMVSW